MLKVMMYWIAKGSELEIIRRWSRVDELEFLVPRSRSIGDLRSLATSAEVIIAGTYVHDEIVLSAKYLKLIHSLAVGVDRYNLRLLRERRITLTTSKGANSSSVAEHVFALILALAKRITFMDSNLKEGRWMGYNSATYSIELMGKVIGIIGLGSIGIKVARIAKALGMKVIAIKRRPNPLLRELLGLSFLGGPEDIDYILKNADFLVLTLPLTKDTKGLIGERELNLMKPSAFLINVSRGPIVDERALFKALNEGWIAGAGIDVWYAYPPDPRTPSPLNLHKLPNVIATPHKAGWTKEARIRALKLAGINVGRYVRGEPLLNVVDLDKGY